MPHTRAPQRLLMVMPYHQLVRKAVAAGFRVWSLWDPSLQSEAYLDQVAEHSEQLLLADFGDESALRALIAQVAREHRVDRVLHLGSENSMPPVVAEAEALGLAPNRAESVHRLNDKAAMRRLLNAGGLSVVRAEEVASVEAAAAAVAAFALPAIVKPAASSGSRGIALIRDADDLDEWTRRVQDASLSGPFVVEEYLEGPEFSVETLTVDGIHHVMGITAKSTTGAPHFVETGHVFPAALTEDDEAAVRASVTGLLDLAGYTFGPAHTEVVLTAHGPRIVESQTRLGGDRIPALVDLSTGFDLEAAVFGALAGEPVTPPTAHRTAAIGFFRLPAGRLESVDGLDEIRALPEVHLLHFPYAPGDVLPRTTDSSTRHGFVIVAAGSPAEASARVDAVRDLLKTSVREEVPVSSKGSIR